MLHKYRAVKSVFIKSLVQHCRHLLQIAVERLLCVGGQIESTRCNKLSDANSEKLLLLKANLKYLRLTQ